MGRHRALPGQRAVLPAPISEDPNQYRAKYSWKDAGRNQDKDTISRRSDGKRRTRADDSLVFDDDEDGAHMAISPNRTSLTREGEQVRAMRDYAGDIDVMSVEQSGFANIEKVWDQPWAASRLVWYVPSPFQRHA